MDLPARSTEYDEIEVARGSAIQRIGVALSGMIPCSSVSASIDGRMTAGESIALSGNRSMFTFAAGVRRELAGATIAAGGDATVVIIKKPVTVQGAEIQLH